MQVPLKGKINHCVNERGYTTSGTHRYFLCVPLINILAAPFLLVAIFYLFHDLLLRSYLYYCVWSVITTHKLTPENHDNNYSPHPLTPTSCLRNNIQLITGISPCCGCP